MARLTLKELAALHNVSYSTARRMSGGNIQRKYTEAERALVLVYIAQGASNADIATRTGIPKSTVRYWRLQHATTISKYGEDNGIK